MSTVALAAPMIPAVAAESTDTAFEHRWAAWMARGRAHDRRVRRRFMRTTIVIAAIGVAAYAFLSS